MSAHFDKVKQFLHELELPIVKEIPQEELVVVNDEENGIKQLYIDCEDPILVLEQLVMKVPQNTDRFFKRLLQINRTLVHGAFVLNEAGDTVLFRDTLELLNLDKNELEGSIKAFSLALFENLNELLEFSKK
ncbi:YbjN domain-containing protein [candidate division KSB1 bacterium]|nr:YbjN domain-containing protein [candidate division KSB1 bacterium]